MQCRNFTSMLVALLSATAVVARPMAVDVVDEDDPVAANVILSVEAVAANNSPASVPTIDEVILLNDECISIAERRFHLDRKAHDQLHTQCLVDRWAGEYPRVNMIIDKAFGRDHLIARDVMTADVVFGQGSLYDERVTLAWWPAGQPAKYYHKGKAGWENWAWCGCLDGNPAKPYGKKGLIKFC